MYCKNCGAKLGSGNKFCTECGTKVELDETVEIQQNPELSQEQESHSEEMKLPELDLKGVFDDEIPMENTSETEWREMPEQSVVEENVEKSSMENEHVEENMQEKNLDPEIPLKQKRGKNRKFIGITIAVAIIFFLLSTGLTAYLTVRHTELENIELKTEIQEELNTYLEFCDKAVDYKNKFAKLYLDDTKKKKVKEKMNQAKEQIVNRAEETQLKDWLTEMDTFAKDTEEENKKYVNTLANKLAKYDTLMMTNEEEKKYNAQVSKFKKTVQNGDYSLAVQCANQSCKYGDKVTEEKTGWNVSIVQQDLSSYPNIRLYLEVTDEKGDVVENLDKNYFVLSEKNSISDLLVYSLGLRDTEELTNMVTKIMSGESININNEPKTFTYDDLLNVDLRLIMPSDTYKYNSKYDVYEDMSADDSYMKTLYDKALKLKIVGIVSPKEGKTTMALNPGVNYTSDLIDYIINYSKDTDVVKKQLKNKDIDIFSGNRFDSKKNNFDFDFKDLVKVDNKKLQSAFNININEKELEKQTQKYMEEIANSITTNVTPAKDLFNNNLSQLANNLFNSINSEFTLNNTLTLTENLLNKAESKELLTSMEKEYTIPADTFKTTYKSLLKGLLDSYITAYNSYMKTLNPDYEINGENPSAVIIAEIKENVISSYLNSAPIIKTGETMASVMTETKMKKDILTKVGDLTTNLSKSFATSLNIDQDKIASAFTLNFSKDELARVVNAMMNKTETTQKTNLITLGYQDKEEPTYISFYFNSFDGKEHFLSFIEDYNKNVSEEKEINYSDTTGILMSSVKTIVNAVSYVLIAFVSISLVVSSIMIGVITYISVYERTKEIGILRAIGASKGNISSIFNAETFIIGFLSGLFGIVISYILIPIINTILHHYIGNIPLSASLEITHALVLVGLAIILTLIGGLIPARAASKKDPVEALRSE